MFQKQRKWAYLNYCGQEVKAEKKIKRWQITFPLQSLLVTVNASLMVSKLWPTRLRYWPLHATLLSIIALRARFFILGNWHEGLVGEFWELKFIHLQVAS
uniref:Uncharacterized protein n=1 Tax=Micrurus lemniscatus lemniscatus TaxID=129467 RepID=A0A2D4IH31_MICLE